MKSPVVLVGFYILLNTPSAAQSRKQLGSWKYGKVVETNMISYGSIDEDRRYKRFVPISQAKRGVIILRKLLRGTTNINSNSKRMRKYEKPGTFETALRQFNSLKPRHVIIDDRPGYGKVYTATVGDRRVILRELGHYSKHRPTIDIIELVPDTDRYIDRIIYTQN